MKQQFSEIYGVIGLGRFGSALAKSLAEAGKELIVLDCNENKVKEATTYTDNAFVVTELTKEELIESGIDHCTTVIVCIGEKIDKSILTTLNVIELGVKRVIAKAISPEQGAVLERLGAEVVFPERDMAERLAKRLTSLRVMEYISLSDEIDISELMLSERIDNLSVSTLNIRARFGLNIIAINHKGTIQTEITPDTVVTAGDILVVCGKRKHIEEFETHV